MELLRFDALRQIDLGIEDALIPAERVSHGPNPTLATPAAT
jgi:hypothetical protein